MILSSYLGRSYDPSVCVTIGRRGEVGITGTVEGLRSNHELAERAVGSEPIRTVN